MLQIEKWRMSPMLSVEIVAVLGIAYCSLIFWMLRVRRRREP